MYRILIILFLLLGVTAPHPIFSTTHNDWRLAGELEVGEKVMTYHGETNVVSNEKKAGSEKVYNLEVKDLHNFLVGNLGVVVHNGCWSSFKQKYGNIYETSIDHCWSGHNPLSKVKGKSYFKTDLNDQIKLKQYLTDAVGKGNIISQDQVTRTVDGVKRTYITIVQDMGQNVGKLQDHATDTNILTMIFDVTEGNPIINNAFPGLP
ncbi:MAG TPA: Hint domain-containing protein [Saprospiraceae bacterium]|nr:Hint domain-containing protein [Saprospiraceae bacterium]